MSTGRLFYSNGSEQQQLKECENNVQSEGATLNRGGQEDTVDFGMAGDLKNSLEKVSLAIYKKFVSDWHSPPEELQNQPLYNEINSGIQSVFFNMKSKARLLEDYEIIISIATGLITHFKTKRGKKVTYRFRFKTRQEEVDFIRKHIGCLLDYWLPQSMQKSRLIHVFLTEILSVNVLEEIINNFSDFTYINETIVAALDEEPATLHKADSGRCDEMNWDIGCSAPDESNAITESGNVSRKKKKRGIVKKLTGFLKRNRLQKQKFEDVPEFRSYCAPVKLHCEIDAVNTGSTEDSEDEENSITSIINTSLQMWLQNNWTAKISEILAEKDEYEISVCDDDAPDVVLWNTKRCVEDFKLIYEKIYQKYPDLVKPRTIEVPTNDADRQFFHSIGTTPDEFINILLILIKRLQDTDAVFFFSPFETDNEVEQKCLPDSDEEDFSEQFSTDGGSTGDSSNSGMDFDDVGIGFRVYNVQNEEEESNKDTKSSSSDLQDACNVSANRDKSKKDDESIVDSYQKESDCKDCYEPDGMNFLRSRKKHKEYTKKVRSNLEDLPSSSVSVTRHKGPQMIMDSTSLHPLKVIWKDIDFTDQNITQTMEQQKQKLQETLLDVLYQLIDEVLEGGKSMVCFLHKIGVLKNLSKYILNSIPSIYAEEQIIWYLNQVAQLLTSQVLPQQLTPDVLQSKALELLKNKVQGLLTNCFVKILFEKQIMNNLKASHHALQDQSANKETIYGLLEDLTKIITNEVAISVH